MNEENFFISFWNTIGIESVSDVDKEVEMWEDLGITVAMSPSYGDENSDKIFTLLDCAEKKSIKVILCDKRAVWRTLASEGETKYRELFAQALKEFGNHSAVYGFFVGDEPNAPDFECAMTAMRIQNEMAPQLSAYINLLPWFDWIGERMGTDALKPYLDRVAVQGKAKQLSYDCYTQMWDGDSGWDIYYNNLREYYEAVKRLQLPFVNIVLSCGHYNYRTPSKNDMQWQLCTSAAMGAHGILWFFVTLPGVWDNYRDAPVNQLGQRTQSFAWLSEVNRVFQNYVGGILTRLTIDTCFHVGKAYGGVPLFEPFGDVLDVSSSDESVPLIFSRFHDCEGNPYYTVCVNSPERSAYVSMTFKEGISLSRCTYGGKFETIVSHTDPIGVLDRKDGQSAGLWLAPGQLAVIRAVKV